MELATPSNDGSNNEHQIITPPAELLTCNICQHSSREPHHSECCGCTLCKPCLEDVMKTAAITCPMCHSQEFTTPPSNQADNNLDVFCTDKEKECEGLSKINGSFNHCESNNGCQFEEVTDSHDCRKGLQPESNHIDGECDHKVGFQHCHINGEQQFIEGEHKEECPKLLTVCPNKCDVGSMPHEDFDKDNEVCAFEEIVCPNGCGVSLRGQNMTYHVEDECVHRMINCRYCHITGQYQDIEGVHKVQCPKFPIACPNKCDIDSIPRDDVEKHIKNCPMELVQCEYHVVGCEERITRKDQKKHIKEKLEEHLSFTKQALAMTQKYFKTMEDETKKSNNVLSEQLEQMHTNYTEQLNPISVKLDRMQVDVNTTQETTKTMQEWFDKELTSSENEISAVKENFKDFQSQAQETTANIIQRITVIQTETKETVSDLIHRLEESENTRKQELEILQKKLTDTNEKLSAAQEDAEKAKEKSKKTIDELTQRLTNTEEDLYITKQQLSTTCQNLANAEKEHATLAASTNEALTKLETAFQTKVTEIESAAQKKIVELEAKLQQRIHQTEQQFYWHRTMALTAGKLSSGDQVVPVIVKMSEYSKKKNHKVTWYSEPFYTHQKGYKMCLCAYAAGLCSGRRSDLSVKLYIMKGPYDDHLTWPLKGYCEIKLLNQISNSDHYVCHNGRYWDYGHKRVTIASWEISNYYMWLSEQFINNEDLSNMTKTCQYLKDDCLYFQVQYVMN